MMNRLVALLPYFWVRRIRARRLREFRAARKRERWIISQARDGVRREAADELRNTALAFRDRLEETRQFAIETNVSLSRLLRLVQPLLDERETDRAEIEELLANQERRSNESTNP